MVLLGDMYGIITMVRWATRETRMYFKVMFWRLVGLVVLVTIFGIVGDATIAVILFIILIVVLSRSKEPT